jgi:hypothetical protein
MFTAKTQSTQRNNQECIHLHYKDSLRALCALAVQIYFMIGFSLFRNLLNSARFCLSFTAMCGISNSIGVS